VRGNTNQTVKGDNDMVALEKRGKMIMAGEKGVRIFKSVEAARRFMANMIWVSKDLTPTDFRFVPVWG
jgi:hypothetical protein